MKTVTDFFCALILVASVPGIAQTTSSISGKLTDGSNGEPVVGANVVVVGTQLGAAAGLDGTFLIKDVPIGIYTLRFSSIGYGAKLVNNVVVRAGVPTHINLVLDPQVIEGDEIVVEAAPISGTEVALLMHQRKASSIRDGISREQIKRTPDATAGDVLRRVTGVSIVDNKFVFVRGMSDRYGNALLNGVRLSSTEPDKKSFTFDLLAANFLESAHVTKTATPDVAGDFSGGLVQLNTTEFPESSVLRLSAASSWNSVTNGNSLLYYDRGPTDWLGFDNGHRGLADHFPSSLGEVPQADRNEFGKSLKNLWALRTRSVPLNTQYQLSYGTNTNILDNAFGYIGALTYRTSVQRSEIRRADYDDAGLRYDFLGEAHTTGVVWGGLLNANYRLGDLHKISFKNLYTQMGEDEVIQMSGINNLTQNDEILTSLRYVSRSVFTTQLEGEHHFASLARLGMQWRAYYSSSTRQEPDLRRMIYSRSLEIPGSEYEAQVPYNTSAAGSSTRFFSGLKDDNRGFESNFTLPVYTWRIKFGLAINGARRTFTARNFVYTMPVYNQGYVRLPLDSLFLPEHIGGSNGFQFDEEIDRRNRYDAGQDLHAMFAMIDAPMNIVGMDWRVVGGVRLENSEQRLASGNLQNEAVNVDYKTVDLLPSVNMTYYVTENINLRMAYSKTVNRPEFREFAPFAFYEFSTRISIYGNPDLRRALVDNYDIRWEIFPTAGELISLSYFHKRIKDAIEQVVVPTVALAGERTFQNAEMAVNSGFEFEMRKSFDFLGDYFSNFALSVNYARIFSTVDLGDRTRPLQGQSPYMINLGVYFTEPSLGTSLTLAYNRFGERISEAATVYTLDIKEQPRDVVDVTITQQLFDRLELKLSGKDILQHEQLFTQGDNTVRSNKRGTTYSFGVLIKI